MKPGKDPDVRKHVRSYDRIAVDNTSPGLDVDSYDPDPDRDDAADCRPDSDPSRQRRQPRDGKDDPNFIYRPDVSR